VGDGHRRVQVQHHVPIAARHKHRLAWILDQLDRFVLLGPIWSLSFWVDFCEPSDGFVRLESALGRRQLDEVFGRVGGEEAPALVSGDEGVPGRGAQRIDVNAGAGTGGAHHHPAVGRTSALAAILEQIVPKVNRNLVVLQQLLSLGVVCIAAVKNVKRAVVVCGLEVIQVVFHLEFDAVSIVVFATLELLVAIFLAQSLKRPLVSGVPVVLDSQDDDGFVGGFEPADEFLRRDGFDVDSFHPVVNILPTQVEVARVIVSDPVLRSAQLWSGPLLGLPDPLAAAVTETREGLGGRSRDAPAHPPTFGDHFPDVES